MSQKGARKSQSAFFLSPATAESGGSNINTSITRKPKRPREEIETPIVVLTDASSTEPSPDVSPNPSVITLLQTNHQNRPTAFNAQLGQPGPPTYQLEKNFAALRLDRLTDKIDRYQSHEGFLKRCIENKVFPNSYQIILEPSIGNHDEKFLKGYHDMLQDFSIQVMKYTADYCAEKIGDFDQQHVTSYQSLVNTTSNDELTEIKKTLAINQAKRTKTLQDTKERKFIRLRYHANSGTARKPPQNNFDINAQNDEQSTSGLQRNNNQVQLSRKNSRRNFHQGRFSRQNSHGNLHIRPNNPSNETNRIPNNTDQINDLQKQLNSLRETNQHQAQQTQRTNDNAVRNTNTVDLSKNGQAAPSTRGEKNKDIAIDSTEILEYISTAMQTLKDFEKRLKTQVNTSPTRSEQY